ncbi:MAG: PrsW family glutamic-type intramembrane protease [Verrucomicrobiales bacterium]|nr:PrsW family glutamic-type intramembrane protease [Verrucomicrobiales bacterium]
MPLISRRKLAALSRDPGFLVKFCIAIVAAALVISAALPVVFSKVARDSEFVELAKTDLESFAAYIRNPGHFLMGMPADDFRDVEFFRSETEPQSAIYAETQKEIESTLVDEGDRRLALLLLDSIHCTDSRRTEAIDALLAIPETTRYRSEFLGDALLANGDPDRGIPFYRKEGEQFKQAVYSRRSTVIALTERKEIESLREVLNQPDFVRAVTPLQAIRAAGVGGDQKQLFFSLVRFETSLLKSPHFFTALFTALIWFVILTIMGKLTKPQLVWGIAAFALGMVSATLTLYVVHIQEDILNIEFHPQDTLANQLIALIAGIGLREEFLKLICFLPVAIGIAKFRSPVLALVAAALTGLGFAMMENLQYFATSFDEFVAWTRLLSANALHFCLTGIVGLSLYQLIRNKGRGWENFLVDFLLVVVAHGLYDGFIMIPMFAEYGVITLVILALIAYRYLDLVREYMPTDGQLQRISPLGVFVVGSAVLACGIMVITALSQSFLQSTGAFANAIGGSIPIAFAFISRLRDL